jgi:hypothetical protein
VGCFGGLLWIASSGIYADRTSLWIVAIAAGIFGLPAILSVYFGAISLLTRSRAKKSTEILISAAIWCIPIGGVLTGAYLDGTPKARFQRLVMRPMPGSVQDFHWHGWVGMGGDREFFITFRASEADTKSVVQHFQLVPCPEGESIHLAYANTNALEVFNLNLSNRCVSLKFPFEPLASPIAFQSSGELRLGAFVEMVTDRDYRRVYLLLQ